MKPEWWPKVGELFHVALEREEDERAPFLEQSCEGNESLRREVESLLAAHHERPADFLQKPIVADAVQRLVARQADSMVGQQLNHYRLIELLGAGGMGEVYLAYDQNLRRKVALKLLPALFIADEECVRRLRREARAASVLNHPNILTIYEVGEAGSTHYIATEYVEGATLRQRMADGPVGVDEALDVTAQVASALAAAHAAGIAHHDIKPENIMVRRDGYIKVVDFGLAGQTGLHACASDAGPGKVLGTVNYMSPEQARGQAVDGRSDIWNLGVVLYEMLNGRLPFGGASARQTLASIRRGEPRPWACDGREIPPELQRIVARALCKQREGRYQTAQELLADLRRLKRQLDLADRLRAAPPRRETGRQAARHTPTSAGRVARPDTAPWLARVSRRMTRHKGFGLWPVIVMTVMTVAVMLLGGLRWAVERGGRHETPIEIDRISRLTTSGNAVAAAVAPDGAYFAYVKEDAGRQSLWGRQVGGGAETDRQLSPPAEVSYVGLSFSPDGEHLYYVVKESGGPEGVLYRIPAFGGAATRLRVGDIETPVTFSPDGRRIAFVGREASGEQMLKLADADGAGVVNLAARRYPDFLMNAAWSPDGDTIACVTGSYLDGFFMTVVSVRVSDGVEEPLTPQRWWSVRRLAWRPDGRGLFLVAMDRAAGMTSYIAHVTYPGGEVHKIARDLNDYRELGVTAGGRSLIAVQSTQTSDLWVAPVGNVEQARLITQTKYDQVSGMAWAPDGRVVCALRKAGEDWNIWAVNADGSGGVQLTEAAGSNLDPAVSPDGRHIVFTSTRSGDSNIWRVDGDGGRPRRLTGGPSDWWPSVSPDGRWVFYASFAGGQPTLWKVSIDGGAPVQVSERFSLLPAISPDGGHIACYLQNDRSKFDLRMAVMTVDGGQLAATFAAPGGKFQPLRWTSDGRALTYIHERDGVSNVWAQPVAGGPPEPITDFTTERIFSFAVSPDDKQIALARGSIANDVILIRLQ